MNRNRVKNFLRISATCTPQITSVKFMTSKFPNDQVCSFFHTNYIDVKHTKSHINDISDLSNFTGHIILYFFIQDV